MVQDSAVGYVDAKRRSSGQLSLTNPRRGRTDKFYTQPRIDIISPNREVFKKFAVNMYALPDGCDAYDQREVRGNRNDRSRCNTGPRNSKWRERQYRQIPNDNLSARSTAESSLRVNGQTVRMNLQDANLLKITTHWCAPLEIPFGRFTVYYFRLSWERLYTALGGSRHPHWGVCRRKTLLNQLENNRLGTPRILFVPISSDAIVRMQSPVRCEGDEQRGRDGRCANFQN